MASEQPGDLSHGDFAAMSPEDQAKTMAAWENYYAWQAYQQTQEEHSQYYAQQQAQQQQQQVC